MAGFYAARSWIIPPLPWLDLQAPLPPEALSHLVPLELEAIIQAPNFQAYFEACKSIRRLNNCWVLFCQHAEEGKVQAIMLVNGYRSPIRPGYWASGPASTPDEKWGVRVDYVNRGVKRGQFPVEYRSILLVQDGLSTAP